jgi:hypothetical protein
MVDKSLMAASFDDTSASEKPRSLWSAAGDEQANALAGEFRGISVLSRPSLSIAELRQQPSDPA